MRVLAIAVLTAALAALPAAAQANTVPNWDRHFLLETAEGAHFEIQMGKIAERKGHSREARAAGRVMVRDHSGELHAVEALAKALGVKVPSSPSILEQHEIGNTSQHTGAAFAAGLLVAPRFTRWFAAVLVAVFGADVLQIAYRKAEDAL